MGYTPAYSIDSNTLLTIGIGLMKTIIVLTLMIFLQVLSKRASLVYHERRRKKFLALWRPILSEAIFAVPENLPKLDRKFTLDFVTEWNALYDKLGGTAHDNLITIARQLHINQWAAEMLVSSHIKIRLTGVITLGNMRVRSAWPYLSAIAHSSETILSMAAYRALTQIDVDKALKEILPKLIKRTDWPASMVAKILKNSHSQKVCGLLADASATAKDIELPNLIKYINVLNCSNSTLVFRHLLAKKVDDQIISLCLHELHDPSAIDLVHRYVDYPRWHVRVNAAHALGKIGSKQDLPHLRKMLHDRQWWVRYRAAQAIVKLFPQPEEIQTIEDSLTDEKAKQILAQAIAEKTLL